MGHYDYIIAGAGAAGLSLAAKIATNEKLSNKSILILDPDPKTANDRTWCYWTKDSDRWDQIVDKKWEQAAVIGKQGQLDLNLNPFHYRMIQGSDFYAHCKAIIQENQNIEWKQERVNDVKLEGEKLLVETNTGTFSTDFCFDSRPIKMIGTKKRPFIWQHFGGWVVETSNELFDPNKATLMDFNREQHGEVRFIYTLPHTTNKALIEYTGFGYQVLSEAEYENHLKAYLEEELHCTDYKILEKEFGKIPMNGFISAEGISNNHIRIGTSGAAVKPASGYAFQRIQKQTDQIVGELEAGKMPSNRISKKRHQLFDRMLLRVLTDELHPGSDVFYGLFKKNTTKNVLEFLDESTSFKQELGIMLKSPQWPFIRAFFKEKFG